MNPPMLRQSERGSFNRCKQRWWWDWREGLVPRSADLGPLWFGTGIHVALAAWYCGPGIKRGPEPGETWERYVADSVAYVKDMRPIGDDERVAKYVDAAALGVIMLEGYRARYGRDEHMHVIAPELTGSTEIPWPKGQNLYDVEEGDVMSVLAWTTDLVYRDLRNDWLAVEEHKTAKQISTRHLALDNQGGTYWAMATRSLRAKGLIKPKEVLRGIEYNFLRKSVPDDRPRDAEGYYVNKPVKADYVRALESHLSEARWGSEAEKEAEFARLKKLPLAGMEELAIANGLEVLGERSKIQPSALFERHMVHRTSVEQRTQLQRIQDEAFSMWPYRDGTMPLTKNPTKDCGWDCSFYQMCELQERGGNWENFKALTYRSQDPYADHRKSAEE